MPNQPDIAGVVGAFELLCEQLEETKARINDRIAGAAQAANYRDVRELTEKAEGVDRIMTQADTLLVEFANMFGQVPDAKTPKVQSKPQFSPSSPSTLRLVLRNKHCEARAIYDGGSVVVLRGSRLALNERDSLQDIYRERRRKLRRRGDLTRDTVGHALTLNTDCRFNSPSGAACFVVGYSANGKQVWTIEGTRESLGERLNAGQA